MSQLNLYCRRIVALQLVLLLALMHSFAAASELPKQPNIIFILCDDLGWGDLGVLHQNSITDRKHHRTPMLDNMAAEGAILSRHYCPAPVCAPSRASLLTGVHQGHAQVRDNQFDKALENNHTLATVLKSAGYQTVLIGKYGLQGDGDSAESWPAYPTKRGFDEFFGYVRHRDGHVHYPADDWPLGNNDVHRSPKELWHNHGEISESLAKCYTTDLFTAKAKHWITNHRTQAPDQPFFMYLAFDTPHAALQTPTVAYPDGRGLEGGVQWIGEPGRMINTAVGEIDSFRHPDYVDRGWTDVEERFATMVRRIDNAVGDVLATLKDLQIDRETLVVLSSDNGPHQESYLDNASYDPTSFQSYGPFDGIKRDVWEGGVRMPTLVWWPGTISPGTQDDSPSQFHDWMATFADVGGVAAPARSDGVSLKPRWTGGNGRPSTIYIEYFQQGRTPNYEDFAPDRRQGRRRQMQVVHWEGYKGVRYNIRNHADLFQIYDLENDPIEAENLAGGGGRLAQIQAAMHDRVLQMRIPNASAKRPYDSEPVPAIDDKIREFEVLVAGGSFLYVPQIESLDAQVIATMPWLQPMGSEAFRLAIESLAVLQGDSLDFQSGAVCYRGAITVPKTGMYEFRFACNQKAFVRLHDIALLDADFGYQPATELVANIHLEKGTHPVNMTCLYTEWTPPEFSLTYRQK